jgi:hypothetical protein
MHQEPHAQAVDVNPLVKPVAGHLFTFEEKIFGMSLTQLLTDIGALTGSFSFTGSFSLVPRIIVCALFTLLVMTCVHGKILGTPLGYWLYLLLRAKMIPRATTWQRVQRSHTRSTPRRERPLPSVQAAWIPIDTLAHGIAGRVMQHKGREIARYWTVLEVEGKNVCLLPESEQVRVFRRFERFLAGLDFHLHYLSTTEQIDPQTAPALLAQKEALPLLSETPYIQTLQSESIEAQERQMTTCTRTRHFLVISASGAEAAFPHPGASTRSLLVSVFRVLTFHKAELVRQEQVLDQLRMRTTLVRRALQQCGLHTWPLEDHEILQLFALCLAPGSNMPSFLPEVVEAHTHPEPARANKPAALSERERTRAASAAPQRSAQQEQARGIGQRAAALPKRQDFAITGSAGKRAYRKRIFGLHGAFFYTSLSAEARFEPGRLAVPDLLAPSRIRIAKDVLCIQTGAQTRYVRTFTITGYGHHLLSGWVNQLHELGLPLLVSTHLEPLDTSFMIKKLEQALTRLESKRLTDQKTLRITSADQNIEAEQIRQVSHALAERRLKIFDVSMTICIHASTLERLEQRSRYLLSHLCTLHLDVRPALYQQDLAWQSCLPVSLDFLQHCVKLTSDVVSTMLPGASGSIGTPMGVCLGFSGSGLSRHPVYLHPWSTDKKIVNPHIVVIGESGQGKSWLGKTLATGLMGLGIADVVVLDKDEDYLPLHEALGGESQRYQLARGCPINLFDLPYGPADVDPEDSADILGEFLDNDLLTGLSLLVTDEETRLSKREESYLMAVARATYAAKGLTTEAIRENPATLLLPAPTLADFMTQMQAMPASSHEMQSSLLERLEKASYLFQAGGTSISLDKPLTIFSIHGMDSKWFALMTYLVHTFLTRHRATREDERYLAYIVEEASFLLRHPAGRRYLENGSRGFRKLGIAQITLSQHPRDFLEAGQVVLSNAGTVCYLGMESTAAEKLHLPEELERLLIDSQPGSGILRIGNEYAPLTVWSNPVYRALFTTDPAERRAMKQKANKQDTNNSPSSPIQGAGL